MVIDKLPDNILLMIFRYLSKLEDLCRCYFVSPRWKHLINKRAAQADCLIYFVCSTPSITESFSNNEKFISPKIILTTHSHWKKEQPIILTPDDGPLKRLADLHHSTTSSLNESFSKQTDLNVGILHPAFGVAGFLFKRYPLSNFMCDQMVIHNAGRVVELPHNYPTLKRFVCTCPISLDSYDFDRIEILEAEAFSEFSDALSFIETHKHLKSVYLTTRTNDVVPFTIGLDNFHYFEPHMRIENLVLNVVYWHKKFDDINSYGLVRSFKMFPALKNLALRNNLILRDQAVLEIIDLLPKLILLDVRGSLFLSDNIGDIVKNHCNSNRRVIKFYHLPGDEQIKKDWPQLSTRNEPIAEGFDFMKHCFLKSHEELPLFLIP